MSDQTDFFGTRRDTLAEARVLVDRGRDEGVTCPCCHQFAKTYKRKLNSGMARALIVLYRCFSANSNSWMHVPSYLNERGANPTNDFSLLAHWGLIEAMSGDRADGSKRIGWYRMTRLGFDFVNGQATVPRYVFLYNQTKEGFSEETTTIRLSLGDKFNYDELMADM